MPKPFIGIVLSISFVCGGCSMLNQNLAIQQVPVVTQQKPKTAWQKAKDALQANDTKGAEKYASQMLRENTNRKAWYYGNVVHEGNQILGLAALQEGHVADAKMYLLAAGKTPGSPQIDSFGPNMMLAQQLLDRGEKATVIQYLDLVAKFWAYTSPQDLKKYEKKKPGSSALFKSLNNGHRKQIADWKKQIRAGKKPKLINQCCGLVSGQS